MSATSSTPLPAGTSNTLPTAASGGVWTDTLTLAAASGAGSTQAPPGGTYYVTVQAAGGGYTDSVIIEVTVSAPNVTVTSPGNGSVLMAGCTTNVSASADATDGSLSLSSVTISANGTSIGTIDYPLTEGEPTAFTWPVVAGANTFTATAVYGSGAGEVSVTSASVTVTGASSSVTAGAWATKNNLGGVWVGRDFYAPVTATISPTSLDSNGSQPTFATYSWSVLKSWYSFSGSDGTFIGCSNPSSLGWAEAGVPVGIGVDNADFDGEFGVVGYYIVEVSCTATIFQSSAGMSTGTVTAVGYIGGAAGSTSHATLANALRPMDDPSDHPQANPPPPSNPVDVDGMEIRMVLNGGSKKPVKADGGSVVIGQKVELSVANAPSGATLAWTIKGDTFQSETPSTGFDGIVPLPADIKGYVDLPTPTFYWWAGGSNKVSVNVTCNGATVPLSATITALVPTANILINNPNNLNGGANGTLHCRHG